MAMYSENPRITYVRHGEVTLLLRPREAAEENLRGMLRSNRESRDEARGKPVEWPEMDGADRTRLARELGRGGGGAPGVNLYSQDGRLPAVAAFSEINDTPRRVIPLERGNDLLALYTVNLEDWIPNPVESNDRQKLAGSIGAVFDAVTAINGRVNPGGAMKRIPTNQRQGIRFGSYDLLGASPNWLGLGFNG